MYFKTVTFCTWVNAVLFTFHLSDVVSHSQDSCKKNKLTFKLHRESALLFSHFMFNLWGYKVSTVKVCDSMTAAPPSVSFTYWKQDVFDLRCLCTITSCSHSASNPRQYHWVQLLFRHLLFSLFELRVIAPALCPLLKPELLETSRSPVSRLQPTHNDAHERSSSVWHEPWPGSTSATAVTKHRVSPPGSVMRSLIILALFLRSVCSTFWRESQHNLNPGGPHSAGPTAPYIPGMIKTPRGVAVDYSERNVPQSEIKRLFESQEPPAATSHLFLRWEAVCQVLSSLFILLRLGEKPVEALPCSQRSTGGFLTDWKAKNPNVMKHSLLNMAEFFLILQNSWRVCLWTEPSVTLSLWLNNMYFKNGSMQTKRSFFVTVTVTLTFCFKVAPPYLHSSSSLHTKIFFSGWMKEWKCCLWLRRIIREFYLVSFSKYSGTYFILCFFCCRDIYKAVEQKPDWTENVMFLTLHSRAASWPCGQGWLTPLSTPPPPPQLIIETVLWVRT